MEFLLSEKMIQFAESIVLLVELSSGNKLQFWKEKYLRHTTHKNLGSYGYCNARFYRAYGSVPFPEHVITCVISELL